MSRSHRPCGAAQLPQLPRLLPLLAALLLPLLAVQLAGQLAAAAPAGGPPAVRYSHQLRVLMKSARSEYYVFLHADDGSAHFGTRALQPQDPDAELTLQLYTQPDGCTLAVLGHSAARSFLSVAAHGELQLTLHNALPDMRSVRHVDGRFFYLRNAAGDSVALEAAGTHRGLFLSVNETALQLQSYGADGLPGCGDTADAAFFPDELRFELVTVDTTASGGEDNELPEDS